MEGPFYGGVVLTERCIENFKPGFPLASEVLGFTPVLSKNIFRKKKIIGELDGYNCEVEVYTRSHGKSSTTYVSFFAYFPESFDMGLKINWRGEFDGDDEYITDLFIKRNEEL